MTSTTPVGTHGSIVSDPRPPIPGQVWGDPRTLIKPKGPFEGPDSLPGRRWTWGSRSTQTLSEYGRAPIMRSFGIFPLRWSLSAEAGERRRTRGEGGGGRGGGNGQGHEVRSGLAWNGTARILERRGPCQYRGVRERGRPGACPCMRIGSRSAVVERRGWKGSSSGDKGKLSSGGGGATHGGPPPARKQGN